ncbi:putative transcriptional regulator, AsnC family [Desulfofarcimen acetoxidans DSM 771]|jgi:DNA-binding Lrp family transcriptional regulator|uniref:siroheme decarboxylase n=1 Tax=Desulfofarcimen acetoxidans (strain ATCC 49208 / DSM 771 / KCTC 5769 / VKM B-1644 / 5575) TaxID=485916 RepID=C8W5F6_DESAS|nr:AsnC family transcriptional regulator [Desulfofarcimen acetoxidans]ACV62138.1 putative transcriptional regulator, AsnC family [Desulfofarcimen acetoxidans DSM 771]
MDLEKLDQLDKKLLNIIQTGFPITTRPYRELAEKLATSEADIINRIERLQKIGVIRRLGGIFDSRSLGYTGTLCAMQVPEDRIDEVAAVINSYPGITHNYLREHKYNMWFTLLAESKERIQEILLEIKDVTAIKQLIVLPAENIFKIKVNFDTEV